MDGEIFKTLQTGVPAIQCLRVRVMWMVLKLVGFVRRRNNSKRGCAGGTDLIKAHL